MPTNPTGDRSSELLGHLMRAVGPSLALFLDDSGIWSRPGAEQLKLAIADLCTDLRSLFDQAGVLLDAWNIPGPQVEYPIRYTALHDVSLGYLLPQLQEETRRQIALVESCGDVAGEVGDLLREARTTLQSHLDVLEQFTAKPAHDSAETAKPAAAQ